MREVLGSEHALRSWCAAHEYVSCSSPYCRSVSAWSWYGWQRGRCDRDEALLVKLSWAMSGSPEHVEFPKRRGV